MSGASAANASQTAAGAKEVPLSSMGKVAKWVSTHRQALINIFGMYIVFSYSIHNYRIQLYVDEREAEYKKLNRELERVHTALSDDAWCIATEEAVRKKKGVRVLQCEIEKVLHPLQQTQEESVVAKMAEGAAKRGDSSNSELASLLGSILSPAPGKGASGGSNSSGGGTRMV